MNSFRTWLKLLETFDPLKVEHYQASFLYVDGDFVPVNYQSHAEALAKVFKVAMPPRNQDAERMAVLDHLNADAAKRGIVQGSFTPPLRGVFCSMALLGTLPAMRAAYGAFRTRYPDLLAQLDKLAYDVVNQHGKRVKSDFIEGVKIDRMFGARSPV
jgi:hypothetical protein